MFYRDYGDHPLHHKLSEQGIDCIKLNGRFHSLFAYLRATHQNDVIHTHGYKAGIVSRLLGVIAGRTVVSTYHCGDRGQGKLAWYTWLDKFTQGLSKNIAVSAEIATWLGKKVLVMDNFISPTANFKNVSPSLTKQPLQLAFVGRLSHEKGPDIYTALAVHHAGNSTLQFNIFGDGPMRKSLEQQAPTNIRFWGFCADMEQHWSTIDALVISSRQEGMPMVAIEAMMYGVSVIATPCGALPSLLGDNERGWLAKSTKPEAIFDAIDNFRNTPLQQRMKVASKARHYVLANCSGQTQWQYYEKLYQLG